MNGPACLRAFVAMVVVMGTPLGAQDHDPRQRSQELLAARRQADSDVWADEREAQAYEATFVALWDRLRREGDRLSVLASFPLATITVGEPASPSEGRLGIRTADLSAGVRTLDPDQWAALVGRMRDAGYALVQTEWHHAAFRTGDRGTRHSTFNIVINATNTDRTAWYDITGPIEVTWSNRRDGQRRFIADAIDASGLTVRWRTGPAVFEETVLGEVVFPANYGSLIACDLDGDGLSEILCPPDNTVFRNRGAGSFERDELCAQPVGIVLEGLVADFSGDGVPDLLVAGSNPGPGRPPTRFPLFLYAGDGTGAFDDLPTLAIDPSAVTLKFPNGLTAGDIDADGDLDLFVPQYLQPYVGGQFPTPYYDANDGFPAYLLLNNGDGTFLDMTESAGLTAKRKRRTFRSSLVDLDEDGDLDLLVVSDFAGIDLYANDGTGKFTDVTGSFVDLATNFGMAHTLGDYNADGFLDFYVTGMASTTARRLHAMGLGRTDHPDYQTQRIVIGYGNRMYLRAAPGRFEQPDFRDAVARSGWSWGCVTLDFNNDGDQDIYICNGNKTGTTAKDYCTTFWCHDIYSGGSEADPAQFKVYLDEARPYLHEGMSWNGFEHNHLLMNTGSSFANVAFLANAAIEADCRAVLADDFDGDGRPDLLVDARAASTDRDRQLRLLLNRSTDGNNWIGVRLRGAPGVSTLGARVTVKSAGRPQTAAVVAGDSYGAQQAPVRHFGLGDADAVDSIEVRWPNGSVTRLEQPQINTYHTIKARRHG